MKESSTTVSNAAAIDLLDLCLRYQLVLPHDLPALGVATDIQLHLAERMPESAYVALWERLAQSKHAEGSGLLLGQMINPNAKGLLASWVSQTATLGEALNVFIQHTPLMNPSERWELTQEGGRTLLTFSFCGQHAYPSIAIERSMSAMVAWARILSGQALVPKRALFRFAEPGSLDEFYKLFGRDLQFSVDDNQLEIDPFWLGLPVLNANSLLKSLIQERARNTWRLIKASGSFTAKVQQHLEQALQAGRSMTADGLSSQLCMSRQTLYRQLKKEGTSFQMLYEQARKQLALNLLRQENLSMHALSVQLGFKESSSFYKAFQRWFGMSPKAFLDLN